MLESNVHVFKISFKGVVLFLVPCNRVDYNAIKNELDLELEFDDIPNNKVIEIGGYTICRLHINNLKKARPKYVLDWSVDVDINNNPLDKIKNIGGIYKIQNTVNKRTYIGKSRHCHDRLLNHINCLRIGEHTSSELQEDFDEYGESCFSFSVLKYEELAYKLYLLENKYIDQYNAVSSGYNTVFDDWEVIRKIIDKDDEYSILLNKGLEKFKKKNWLVESAQGIKVKRSNVYNLFKMTSTELRVMANLINFGYEFKLDDSYNFSNQGGLFYIEKR